MMAAANLPPWAALLAALFLFVGALLSLIGSVGLLRFKTFYERVHAPTLGTTLGAGCILIASMVYFSVNETRWVIHELLITVFLTVTTPVSLMLLVRAADYRDHLEGQDVRQDAAGEKDASSSAG